VVAATVIVFALIAAYLRSMPLAFLGILPNAVALVLLFGGMGHVSAPLDYGAMVVAPIAFGIATDDTIHFLTAYSRKRGAGLERLPALLSALAIVAATLADLLVLPALILSASATPPWLPHPFKSRARGKPHPPARSDAF
jgi:hypothetical protein